MTTDRARWLRLSQLFDRTIDLDETARQALLDVECAGDPGLRAELQRMLDADAHASGACLDAGVAAVVDLDDPHGDDEPDAIGQALGPWRLQRLLGRGGMGRVYLACRGDDPDHRVAIKRLHRRWDGSAQARRFAQERRILAMLSHPNLPRLVDHGVDGDGRPWFALEYVQGQPLVAWADQRKLDLRARIDLLRQVCGAVQHAHEHFVVHRDLKPANILVDGGGHPKVLDFGVAKRIDSDAGTTRTGVFAGFTPEYAAPEQLSGSAVNAATDVYALGVLLFQLLTGRLPYEIDADDLRKTADAITSRPAERLDRALGTGTPQEVAHRIRVRDTTPAAFARFVRGDLTRIVQTALAKEAERRYASVQAFSEDLKRFLSGRPVSVTGDTFGYRARKFVQRNRWGVAMGALAVLALAGGTAFATWRAHAERVQRERSEAVLAFVGDLFSLAPINERRATQLTVPEMLERASGRIDGAFADDPIGKGQLLAVVAGAYTEMDLGEPGIAYSERAMATLAPFRDEHPALYLDAVVARSEGLKTRARHEDLVQLVDHELPFARRHWPGQQHLPVLLASRGWSRAQLGDVDGAAADLRESVDLYERAKTPPNRFVATSYGDLAQVLSDGGDPKAALALLRKAHDIGERAPDQPRVNSLTNLQRQAREHYRLGEVARSIELLEGSLPEMTRIAGDAYPQAVTGRNLLSQAYAARGEYSRALREADRNTLLQEAGKASTPEAVALSRLARAKLLTYADRADEALPLASEGVAFLRGEYAGPTTLRGRAQWILGETRLRLGDCAHAVPVLQAALDDERALVDDTPSANAAEALDSLGRCSLLSGNAEAAIPLLRQAVSQFEGALGHDDLRTLRSRVHLRWAEHRHAPDNGTLQTLQAACDAFNQTAGRERPALVRQATHLLQAVRNGQETTGINSLS